MSKNSSGNITGSISGSSSSSGQDVWAKFNALKTDIVSLSVTNKKKLGLLTGITRGLSTRLNNIYRYIQQKQRDIQDLTTRINKLQLQGSGSQNQIQELLRELAEKQQEVAEILPQLQDYRDFLAGLNGIDENDLNGITQNIEAIEQLISGPGGSSSLSSAFQ